VPSGEISARDARDLRATSELVVTLVLFGSSFPAFKLATERFGVGTVVGLRFALEMALHALATKSGHDASTTIASLRDKAICRFKDSEIRREWGMDPAARPATEIIAAAFNAVLRDLKDGETQH